MPELINYTAPIDITAVLTAVADHGDVLKAIDRLDANEVLQHATGIPGVTNSYTLGKVEGGKYASMYNGVFLGRRENSKVVPRTVTVYPIKIEDSDEPERYRRSWITKVRGNLWNPAHPFELWLVQQALEGTSSELRVVLFVAERDEEQLSESANSDIKYSFDGWGSITMQDKTAGKISAALGNMFATAAFTVANIGDELLKMWRKMPETFRRKKSKMFLSQDLLDLYNDWLDAKYTFVAGVGEDEKKPTYLRGTGGKVELIAVPLPEGSQWVLLTTIENMIYAFDSEEDMKNVKPFNGGNPYRFQLAGKFVFGCQFISIHKSEFCINDKPLTPATQKTSDSQQASGTQADPVGEDD